MLRSIDVATDLASAADLDLLLSARTADGGLPDSPPKMQANGPHTLCAALAPVLYYCLRSQELYSDHC